MWHAKLTAGLLAAVMAMVAVGAGAYSPTFRDTPLGRVVAGNLGRLMTLRAELNLTDEQRTKIREVLSAHRLEIVGQAKSVWEKRQALRTAALDDGANEAAIRKAAEELGKAAGDAAVLASKLRKEVSPLLTEEQRAKIRETRGEMSGAMEAFFAKATEGKIE